MQKKTITQLLINKILTFVSNQKSFINLKYFSYWLKVTYYISRENNRNTLISMKYMKI